MHSLADKLLEQFIQIHIYSLLHFIESPVSCLTHIHSKLEYVGIPIIKLSDTNDLCSSHNIASQQATRVCFRN